MSTQPKSSSSASIPRRFVYMILVSYISTLAVVVISLWYANSVNQESDTKWCELLSTLDNTYSSAPPTTELGRRVANSIDNLRSDFHCG